MSAPAAGFTYAEFTSRNLGFVDRAEQELMRCARVFVCGVGGMGGACIQTLTRAGVGQFAIADFDRFEVSNLNRQVFANLDNVGLGKTAATLQQMRRINPGVTVEVLGADWVARLDALLGRYRIVINGTDDVRASLVLYRKAREHGATVIDAYASPLPSVCVVRPGDPRPEERLKFPSVGRDTAALDAASLETCFLREIEYVLAHSSTLRHIDTGVAREFLAGRGKRPSFAPMVIATGNLMAFETVKLILGRGRVADARGYFFNPWSMRVELPRREIFAGILRRMARHALRRLMAH